MPSENMNAPEWDLTPAHGPSRELHSDDIKIDQREVGEEIVLADSGVASASYLADLAFMEEPVTIRVEPSSDPNAATLFEVWCNGKGAELFRNGRWVETTWLPIGEVITIKRKILEIIARTKIDRIQTGDFSQLMAAGGNPDNRPKRFTSAVHSFSILEDKSPKGAAWMTEMRRRNY